MTDDTIHFEDDGGWVQSPAGGLVTLPVLTAQEARILLDHLDNVQAAQLLGPRWDVWVAAKTKLVHIEYDGSKP